MMLSNGKPYNSESLDNADDPWEMVGDEIAPLAASQSNDAATSTAPPGVIGPSLDADVPRDRNEDERDAPNGYSGVSSVTGDRRSVEGGDGTVDSEEGDTPDEEQEPRQEPSISPSNSLAKPAKEVSDKEEEIEDGSGNKEEPRAPPSLVSEELDTAGTPFATSVGATSAPAVGLSEKRAKEETPKEGTSERPSFLDSLSNVGLEKERIGKAIGKMTGEWTDNTRPWDVIRAAARDFEQQHGLRRRTEHCARTVSHSAQELLSTAEEEAQLFSAHCRETWDDVDVRARATSAEVKYAASSAKDSLSRVNEEHHVTEKVATAAAVGGVALLALGNVRAGILAMTVAGSSMAAGEAMKYSSAHSISTSTRDHGLREGLHLD